MLALVSLGALLSTATPAIAIPGVQCARVDAAVCDSMAERLIALLGEGARVRVISQRDIAQLLGLERQRQLMGCADEGSCLAELGGALGVDGLLFLSITRSDPYFIATARVVRARDGAPWVSATERVDREGEVFAAIDRIAERFRDTIAPAQRSSASTTVVRLLPAAVGLAAGATGLGLFLSASSERAQLQPGATGSPDDRRAAVERGRAKEQAGVGLMIAAAAGVAASALWLALGGSPDVTPSVAPVSGGAAASVDLAW